MAQADIVRRGILCRDVVKLQKKEDRGIYADG